MRLGVCLAAISLVCATASLVWWRHTHVPHVVARKFVDYMIPIGPKYPDPPGILIHHSDTPAKLGKVVFNEATLDRIAQTRGFSTTYEGKTYHISYDYVILPDGKVEKGRPDHCLGAHCPKFNNWIGICLIGDFMKKSRWWPSTPTAAQKKSLVSLCERLMTEYHIPPENVRRHGDMKYTYCPGTNFPYKEIIGELTAFSNLHPETRQGATIQPAVNLDSPDLPVAKTGKK
jgi:hypothetical protein